MSIFNGSLFVSSIVQNNPSPNSNKKKNYNPTWRRRKTLFDSTSWSILKAADGKYASFQRCASGCNNETCSSSRTVQGLLTREAATTFVCVRLRELLNNRNKFRLMGKHVRTASATCRALNNILGTSCEISDRKVSDLLFTKASCVTKHWEFLMKPKANLVYVPCDFVRIRADQIFIKLPLTRMLFLLEDVEQQQQMPSSDTLNALINVNGMIT